MTRVSDEYLARMASSRDPILREIASELIERRAKERAYQAGNPLGGPARLFDAIADRIRAGDEFYSVLADFGLTFNDHGGGCPEDAT